MDFEGLSAFPLTPMDEQRVDETAFGRLVGRLAEAGVDSIGALGSTGSYAYLERSERAQLAKVAVQAAEGTPVMIGIGALRTRQVLEHADDAQRAGASALLLAPVSYQPLRDAEVLALFERVSQRASVPLCVYDNPQTTHFTVSDELYAGLARLDGVRAVKAPAPPAERAAERIARLGELLDGQAALGVSGDALATESLLAGARSWYSVIGGLLPQATLAVARPALAGEADAARAAAARFDGFWRLFAAHGSLRVVAAAAAHLGLTAQINLPQPLKPLDRDARAELVAVLDELDEQAA